MSKNDLQINEAKKEVLIKRYEFYTQEARHQRMMMWEAAKWFSAIVTGLIVLSGQLFIRFADIKTPTIVDAIIPIILFGLVFIITIACIFLIRSFYRTNLIYLSMIGKVEEELGFDERNIKDSRKTFKHDEYITWHKYKKDRKEYETSKRFVEDQVTIWGTGIYARLSWVFIVFGIFSLLAIYYIVAQLC